jgi:hypothetical protein
MTKFNLSHFKKCLTVIIEINSNIGKIPLKSRPTADELLKTIPQIYKLPFSPQSKTKTQRKSSKSKQKTKQIGGNMIFNFLKRTISVILGIADPAVYGPCAYLETTLNLLVWSAFLYALSVPAATSLWGISLYSPRNLMEFLEGFSAPHDYIMSLLPEMPQTIREATLGRLATFGTRLWEDYNVVLTEEGGTAFFIIAKLIRMNSVLYEAFYLLPIICLVSTVWEACRTRCS